MTEVLIQTASSLATLVLGYPEAGVPGLLEVSELSGHVYQRFTGRGEFNRVWTRGKVGTWYPWKLQSPA